VPPNNNAIPTLKLGDIVSFSSESLARSELPLNPKIFRIRTDVSWVDVLTGYYRELQYLNGIITILFNFSFYLFILFVF
jgi:hypothetical protein